MSAGYMRSCAGKTRHPDKASAQQQRASLVAAGKARKDNMDVYRCVQCGGYHVGHNGRRRPSARRKRR